MPALSRFRRALGLLLAAGLTVTALTACSSESQAAEDAYRVGCPALDTALAGGSVVNRAAIRALEAMRQSGQLAAEPAQWVEAALGVLTSSDPNDIPDDARKILVDGCEKHGFPLRNLR